MYQGAAADAWSLGVVGYYCLCGRLPFVGKIETTLIRRIVKLSCRPLPPHISEAASDLLFGALLVTNPAFRPPLVSLASHRWLDPEAAEAAEREAAMRIPGESYWDKVRRGASTLLPKQPQPTPRPRSAIQPACRRARSRRAWLRRSSTTCTQRIPCSPSATPKRSSGAARAELRPS